MQRKQLEAAIKELETQLQLALAQNKVLLDLATALKESATNEQQTENR